MIILIRTIIMIRLLYKKRLGWFSDNQTLPLNLYHSYLAMKIFTQIHKRTNRNKNQQNNSQNDVAFNQQLIRIQNQ